MDPLPFFRTEINFLCGSQRLFICDVTVANNLIWTDYYKVNKKEWVQNCNFRIHTSYWFAREFLYDQMNILNKWKCCSFRDPIPSVWAHIGQWYNFHYKLACWTLLYIFLIEWKEGMIGSHFPILINIASILFKIFGWIKWKFCLPRTTIAKRAIKTAMWLYNRVERSFGRLFPLTWQIIDMRAFCSASWMDEQLLMLMYSRCDLSDYIMFALAVNNLLSMGLSLRWWRQQRIFPRYF